MIEVESIESVTKNIDMSDRSNSDYWRGRKVLILGAARQGTALARYLVGKGAIITINDQRGADELQSSVQSLADASIEWVFGNHPFYLLDDVDLICLSGGIPLSLPFIVEAQKRGIPLSNDTQIFLDDTYCRNVVGITGSAGKTTVTSLVGAIASERLDVHDSRPYRRVWVGGNIGNPLINNIEEITVDDLIIMELSSFQLEILHTSPKIAAVLNITPNHLDRHVSMRSYTEAKARIIAHQSFEDVSILNRDDMGSWNLRNRVRGKLITFGKQKMARYPGTFIEDNQIVYSENQFIEQIMPDTEIPLRGEHNLYNVLAASAIAFTIGVPHDAIRLAVRKFKGVAHRLEFVRHWGGADWYNDSIATAPERSMAAINSFDNPLILLAGGRDKDLPWEEFGRLAVKRLRYLILFGELVRKIEETIRSIPGNQNLPRVHCGNLKEAVQAAANVVSDGEVVLLSPGGTSFDEFKDFEERGQCFRKWVMDL